MENEQDNALIQRIKNGDGRALGEFYEKHREEFAGWAYKKFGIQNEEAMDVYQDTILIFKENIESEKLNELKSTAKTYLFAIGRNKCLEWLRGQGKTVSSESALHPVVDEGDGDLEEKKAKEKILETVEKNLKELTEKCQRILELFYYKDYSMEQIAEEMDYDTTNSAKTQKHKCMKRLRQLHHSN